MKSRNNFSNSVTESDKFVSMTQSAQLAYFHGCANADADGHLTGHKRILAGYGFGEQELEELLGAGLLLDVDGEVYVTHHWINNGYDSRFFTPTMEKCEPYKSGRLAFVGDDGKSAYKLNDVFTSDLRRTYDGDTTDVQRENDAAMVCSADGMVCSAGGMVGSADGMVCSTMGWGGSEGRGQDVSSHDESRAELERATLANHVRTLVDEFGYDEESAWGALMSRYQSEGYEAAFNEFQRLKEI